MGRANGLQVSLSIEMLTRTTTADRFPGVFSLVRDISTTAATPQLGTSCDLDPKLINPTPAEYPGIILVHVLIQ